jgi:hypothetical protein
MAHGPAGVPRGCERLAAVMRIIGRPRVLFAVLASCLVLAGCGSGPSQVGAAVIVGDQAVSVDDVQGKLDKLLQDNALAKTLAQQHKLDLLSRSIVSREVLNRATDEAAKTDGLVVDEKQVAQRAGVLRAQLNAPQPAPSDGSNAGGISQATDAAFDINEVARYQQIQGELAAKYLQSLQIVVDGAFVTSADAKAKAEDLAKKLAADPAKSGELVNGLGQDGQPVANTPISLSEGLLIGSQSGYELASSALFGVTPNTVVAFPLSLQATSAEVKSSTAWFVGLVKSSDMTAKVPADQLQQLAQVPEDYLIKVGQRLVGTSVDKLNIHINPRYGVWDVVANGLSPRVEELAGYSSPALAAKP